MLTKSSTDEGTAIVSPVTAVVGSNDAVSFAIARGLDTAVLPAAAPLPVGTERLVVVAPADVTSAPLSDLDPAAWQRMAHEPIWQTIGVFQRAFASMRDGGGRIVLVAPTIGMAGSPGLVAYGTAIEGIRAMAKSAARQWADRGVGVNTVGVPLGLLVPHLTAATAHLTAPAVAEGDGLLGDVVATISFLLRRDIGHVAGQTVVVDGGTVMLP